MSGPAIPANMFEIAWFQTMSEEQEITQWKPILHRQLLPAQTSACHGFPIDISHGSFQNLELRSFGSNSSASIGTSTASEKCTLHRSWKEQANFQNIQGPGSNGTRINRCQSQRQVLLRHQMEIDSATQQQVITNTTGLR